MGEGREREEAPALAVGRRHEAGSGPGHTEPVLLSCRGFRSCELADSLECICNPQIHTRSAAAVHGRARLPALLHSVNKGPLCGLFGSTFLTLLYFCWRFCRVKWLPRAVPQSCLVPGAGGRAVAENACVGRASSVQEPWCWPRAQCRWIDSAYQYQTGILTQKRACIRATCYQDPRKSRAQGLTGT